MFFSFYIFFTKFKPVSQSPHISLKIKYKNSLSQPFEESGGYKINFFGGGKLSKHLAEIDQACNERMEIIVSAMSEQEGVTEALKASDQMEWVRRINSIHNHAEEIILTELVYT